MASFMQNQRNIFAHLPAPAECLAVLIGTAELTIFGLGGLANPSAWATGFGIPLLTPSQARPGVLEVSATTAATNINNNNNNNDNGEEKEEQEGPSSNGAAAKASAEQLINTQTALVSAIAARNMHNGMLLLAFGLWKRDRTALGLVVSTGLVSTLTDYLVVKWYGVQEAAFGHVIGMVNCVLVGGSLLYWSASDPWFKH